jgi:hypothetical protein
MIPEPLEDCCSGGYAFKSRIKSAVDGCLEEVIIVIGDDEGEIIKRVFKKWFNDVM